MEIEHGRKGTPSRVGEADTFTGRAMLDPLIEDADGEVRINSVMFSPGGRTFWHSHAAGQVLIVGSGHGMVETRDGDRQRLNPGDVVLGAAGRGALARGRAGLVHQPHRDLPRRHRLGRAGR